MTEQQQKQGVKLAQSAPVMPTTAEMKRAEVKGVISPISASTVPSIYNKKLNKLFRGRLVALPGDFTVENTLLKMGRFNISAVPVLKSKEDTTILGFVDTLDILAHLCKLIGAQEGKEEIQESENLREFIQQFKETPIAKLVDSSGKNPFCLMNGNESLADAVQSYLKGTHRIGITDDDGNIVGVISQWTIANYISTVPTDDKEWIPTLQIPVGQAKYSKDPVSVNKNEKTLNCFYKMYSHGFTALPIVDDEGNLWGNISASDLRGYQLYLDKFDDLLKPVSEFIGLIRKQQGRSDNFVVAVHPDTKVKDVIHKFNQEIIHRAYLVENRKLLGVFSLSDMLKDLVVDTHTTSTFAKFTARTQVSE